MDVAGKTPGRQRRSARHCRIVKLGADTRQRFFGTSAACFSCTRPRCPEHDVTRQEPCSKSVPPVCPQAREPRHLRYPGRKKHQRFPEVRWCPGAESNHRHCDFQSHALPTELPGRPTSVREPFVRGRVYSPPDLSVSRSWGRFLKDPGPADSPLPCRRETGACRGPRIGHIPYLASRPGWQHGAEQIRSTGDRLSYGRP
jgi:hypothetical protein